MSEYNHFYDNTTKTRISQCVTADGKYAVVWDNLATLQHEEKVFDTAEEQYDCFRRNVHWYRGY